MASRRKLGGINEQAMLARAQALDTPGRSSCLVIQLQIQGLRRERLQAHGANRAEVSKARKQA